MKYFEIQKPFRFENGAELPSLRVAYHTYGNLNDAKDNVVWICHALTANSDAADWWSEMVGIGRCFDPEHYYIVCANYPGSCYGSSGPDDIDPLTLVPFHFNFPFLTTRDMVMALRELKNHLGINKINTLIGGSIGGFQAMEWAIIEPDLVENLILIACSAKASPWAIALNESQRMALLADQTFVQGNCKGGKKGLAAARSIALLSYRSPYAYNITQTEDQDSEKLVDFKAASYQQYQGEKLVKRFSPFSYFYLTRAIDSHDVGRKRGGIEMALQEIKAKTLVIGISSDHLFPPEEQKTLVRFIQNSEYKEINSLYGHDGFLIENQVLTSIINEFRKR